MEQHYLTVVELKKREKENSHHITLFGLFIFGVRDLPEHSFQVHFSQCSKSSQKHLSNPLPLGRGDAFLTQTALLCRAPRHAYRPTLAPARFRDSHSEQRLLEIIDFAERTVLATH